ncbi:dephospho-CoA kinase [Corynebacterium sp. zg-331]|uniref:dephospho-CoA kinase n=1 Tax=unclassified Corynebacterium TaxID=2624378 RepID=UPI00128BE0AD|nr:MULTISPECIES: dephospho-CoA kinase [unclassified Corynebacterium]MBC3186911.1 dephospho-CoA kinase [Corynebacterium sp. zg-331]MPV53391.1 dephospho-CoA kinase [Corynebacterium sp. zg331]
MRKVGLTGGIGSGKSTVAALLARVGFPVVDADLLAREIVEPGQSALEELARAFGPEILRPDGCLDRAALAERAFADARHTELLNSIMHPRIEAETARRFAAVEAAGATVAIYDMPLLVEKGLHRGMDLTVVVDADPETRVTRLVGRGMSAQDARRRMAAQIDDAARRAAADVLIDNNGSSERLEEQVMALVRRLRPLT